MQDGLVLGSKSKTRAQILRNAGVEFSVCGADIDETTFRNLLISQEETTENGALALARAKAFDVSRRAAGSCVIGADQILECNGRWFGKAMSQDQAFQQLRDLSGQTHRLVCGVVVIRNNCEIWQYWEQAILHMRSLSDRFIEDYLENIGNNVLMSVGCYQIEREGAQLFESVDGDYFTVLGMPLFPLLGFLRSHGFLRR